MISFRIYREFADRALKRLAAVNPLARLEDRCLAGLQAGGTCVMNRIGAAVRLLYAVSEAPAWFDLHKFVAILLLRPVFQLSNLAFKFTYAIGHFRLRRIPRPSHRGTQVMAKLAAAFVWLGLSFVTTGFVNADLRGQFADFKYNCTSADGRRELGFAAGMSLLPPAWLVTPFLTGFFQHGWTLEHGAWGICAARESAQ